MNLCLSLDRLDHQIARFGFQVEAVALDSGYLTIPICKGLSERQIFGVIAHRRYHSAIGLFPKLKFHYDSEQDRYICPNQKTLTYSTTDRKGYRSYKSDPETCSGCPLLEQCTRSKNSQKIHPTCMGGPQIKGQTKSCVCFRKKPLQKRKEKIERSFADSKQLHGLRYC
ncbi:transposase [Bacillus halotolerans]|nr:transposase [Bacillus halotolerans]MBV5121996.1 transposase [Bacillus halotolerans]MCC2115115.1 transposase [Bacillus halotolerans]